MLPPGAIFELKIYQNAYAYPTGEAYRQALLIVSEVVRRQYPTCSMKSSSRRIRIRCDNVFTSKLLSCDKEPDVCLFVSPSGD